MIITISFSELQEYVASHYGQKVSFHCVNENTLFVSTVIPFISREIGLNITVLDIKGQDILLSYSKGIGINLLVKGALSFINNMFPEYGDIVEEGQLNNLTVHLKRIKELEQPLELVDLEVLSFCDDGINMQVSLK